MPTRPDRHFNLFYSYDSGSQKDPDRISQLEDNVTRGLLIVLQHLTDKNRKKFLENLISGAGVKDQFSNLSFDLQNINDKDELDELQKRKNKKILLVITRDKQDLSKEKISKGIDDSFSEILNRPKDEKEEIKKKINSLYKSLKDDDEEGELIYELESKKFTKKFKRKELSSYYEYFGDCRPDGWIYNDYITVLIEAKIGGNEVGAPQLYRHVTGKHGFGVDNIVNNEKQFQLIQITWGKIANILQGLLKKNMITSDIEEHFIENFLEYIAMTDQIFNPYKYRNDPNKRYAQLEILVNEMIKSIEGSSILQEYKDSLKIDRKYGGYIGKQIGSSKSAHYNVQFNNPNLIGINLTLFSVELSKEKKEILIDFINDKTANINIPKGHKISEDQSKLMRYNITAGNYRNINKTQQGDSIETVTLNVNFYERVMNQTKISKDISKTLFGDFFEIYKKHKDYFKQIDLSYNIEFFDWRDDEKSDKDNLRKLNHELVDNPEMIVAEFIEFIKDSIHIAIECGL